MVGMFQKEVAMRITSDPGSKNFGILSVLTQVFYETEYLFDVPPEAFKPPPRVVSAVMKMQRSQKYDLAEEDYPLLKKIVKLAFAQRRKKLSNALKALAFKMENIPSDIWDKRAEHLSVEEYLLLMKNYQVSDSSSGSSVRGRKTEGEQPNTT